MTKSSLPSLLLAACLVMSGAAAYWVGTAGAFGEEARVAEGMDAGAQQLLSPEPGKRLQLIELFTSHGCSSCPPADQLLGELLGQDPSLMALEYHVDYWDSLVHGKDGSWKDPFSKPEFTQRQRAYDAAGLTGRNGVYTPQMVINGRYVAVGSDQRRVRQALQQGMDSQLHIGMNKVSMEEGQADQDSTVQTAGAELQGTQRAMLSIHVEAGDEQLSRLQGAEISLVRYIDQASTDITAGENNRKQLVNHRIVFDVSLLGQLGSQSPMQYRVEAPIAGEGCIVMVQDKSLTPVLAAAQCP